MYRLKTGLILILLLLCTAIPSLNAQCAPIIVSRKRVIVQVEVNGRGPFNFLLDTGSTITIIDRSIAKELPENGQVELYGIGEREKVDSRRANISVGTFSDADLPVLVVDLKKTEANEAVPTLGILGNDVLMDAGRFSLDYKTGCLEFPQH